MWQREWLLSIISFFEARHSHCVTVSASADRAQGFAEGLLTACRFRLSALPISGKNGWGADCPLVLLALRKADVWAVSQPFGFDIEGCSTPMRGRCYPSDAKSSVGAGARLSVDRDKQVGKAERSTGSDMTRLKGEPLSDFGDSIIVDGKIDGKEADRW